ncbi:hypothetical protein [Candidatus Mycoplasma haematohominis]|uniref:Uncharacterized protein n=1 Tax=Candidatus Mycoplasma haematohominis TaxID=1494318 RepID=A0A478FUK2_9MOLU|nr:hypothetical protein [Candidatus Mycoplasma haemohominis]GCE63730.1 hypothetical protein MHSWG343_07300 [Candidatus Mycoplasma haemohominis]
MTSQAVGAGVVGTAVVGGGGTLAAYAAGAFGKDTYLTQAKSDSEIKEKKDYIGNNKSTIEERLGDTSTPKYWDIVKGKWDNMLDDTNTLGKPSGGSSALFGDNDKATNKLKIATFVNKWCESISKKELKIIPNSEGNEKNTWEAFKEVCFVAKAVSSTVVS